MATFTVEKIQLSSVNPETGVNNTASVYRLDGIDRQLSIGELAMALCLRHATDYEKKVVEIMAEMNSTTYRIEQLTKLEEALTTARGNLTRDDGASGQTIGTKFTDIGLSTTDFPKTASGSWDAERYIDWLKNEAGVTLDLQNGVTSINGTQADAVITAIEAKLDQLNTFSQEKMIELQSNTNKRDQSYDLAAALIKSFSTVLTGNANNL